MVFMADTPNQWQINPQGCFARHFDLFRDGQQIASLQMFIGTEGCRFTLAGHDFEIAEGVLPWPLHARLLSSPTAPTSIIVPRS